jgi:hypothetical protein
MYWMSWWLQSHRRAYHEEVRNQVGLYGGYDKIPREFFSSWMYYDEERRQRWK